MIINKFDLINYSDDCEAFIHVFSVNYKRILFYESGKYVLLVHQQIKQVRRFEILNDCVHVCVRFVRINKVLKGLNNEFVVRLVMM